LVAGEARPPGEIPRETAAVEAAVLAVLVGLADCGIPQARNTLEALGARVF